MKFIRTIALIIVLINATKAVSQSFKGKNTKSADPLKGLRLDINQEDLETIINVFGAENLLDEAEKQFKYAPKYLDCSNCNGQGLKVVYEIIGEYTFGGHSGSKTFSLRYVPTVDNKKEGLKMVERHGENLISVDSFKRTITKGTTLYIKLIEVRGYIINNSIRTDKKFYRLGKLFKF